MISFNTFDKPKEPIFYTKLPKFYNNLMITLGVIFNTLTLNLLFNYTYDYFFNRQYYLNRRLLLKYIESLMFCEHIPFKTQESKIDEIDSIYLFESFYIIIYKKMNITVHINTETYHSQYNTIGLFYSSKKEDKIVKDIILLLKGLTVK